MRERKETMLLHTRFSSHNESSTKNSITNCKTWMSPLPRQADLIRLSSLPPSNLGRNLLAEDVSLKDVATNCQESQSHACSLHVRKSPGVIALAALEDSDSKAARQSFFSPLMSCMVADTAPKARAWPQKRRWPGLGRTGFAWSLGACYRSLEVA